MKKILLINNSFAIGGIESSLVNTANALAEVCDVDLFVYYPEGPMRERLHENIRILPVSWRFQAIGMPLKQVLRSKDIRMIAYRLFITVWTKIFDNALPMKLAIRHQPKLPGYDAAIAFSHEKRKKLVASGFARVADQLTDAKVKISWIHYDSASLDLDHAYNTPLYQRMDRIFCVSKSLMEGFQKNLPALADKVDYCYNFMDYPSILDKSALLQERGYPEGRFICFSACRLSREKALVRAVKALAPVFRQYPDVDWYIAGSGDEKEALEQTIAEEALTGRIVLLGNQSNPYPYMKHADLVMNVSYHEAAPMVFREAMVLGTPVFATRTSSAMELLQDGVDSFVCENSEAGIRNCFAQLMQDREKIAQAKRNLQNQSFHNQESLNKILSLL